MIVTVTLNASIDKAYRLTQPLEVGIVQRVAECIDNAGGKGLNCARAVATCKEAVIATGFVGGHNGRLLCDLLDADGIKHQFVETQHETRCCINVLDPRGTSTEFLEPGRSVSTKELTQLEATLDVLAKQADVVTLNGSVPKGLPDDIYARLIKRIKAQGASTILDTSGKYLQHGLAACPTLVKPNAVEVAEVLGRPATTHDDLLEAVHILKAKKIAYVVVSLGKDGAIMASDEGVFRGTTPPLDVVNPVGSGDVMVGAFAAGLARNLSTRSCLAYALACSSANCLSASTGHFDPSVASELQSRIAIHALD